jgi:hypothetical protein
MVNVMLDPLNPDIRLLKWAIVAKLLEIIGSPRASKIACRLKYMMQIFSYYQLKF